MSQEEARGLLITWLREQRLWTRERLAKEAGVSPTTVAQAEEGRTHIRLATIGKLARALEVDPQELLHPKKAEAPSSRPYKEADGAEESADDRIDSLQSYRESILAVVEKVGNEFEELRGTDSREQLLTLYTEVAWTRLGLADFLGDEEIMQERTDVPEEEQRARDRVWRALSRFDELAEDIEEVVDALEEKPTSVTHLADRRRQRAG